MPMMQVALGGLNRRFDKAGVAQLTQAELGDTASFAELTRSLLDEDLPEGFDTFIDSMPVGLQRAIRAAVGSAVERGLPVTFAWAPAYDWEVSIWDVADTTQTHGGMTVVVRSRYPDDTHPLDTGPAGA